MSWLDGIMGGLMNKNNGLLGGGYGMQQLADQPQQQPPQGGIGGPGGGTGGTKTAPNAGGMQGGPQAAPPDVANDPIGNLSAGGIDEGVNGWSKNQDNPFLKMFSNMGPKMFGG